MAEDFGVGDAVIHKAGGPKMIAEWIDENIQGTRSVCCSWFDKQQKPQKQVFPVTSIERWEGPSSKPMKSGIDVV